MTGLSQYDLCIELASLGTQRNTDTLENDDECHFKVYVYISETKRKMKNGDYFQFIANGYHTAPYRSTTHQTTPYHTTFRTPGHIISSREEQGIILNINLFMAKY